MDKKRLTAIKAPISAVTKGSFVVQEGFNPSYVVAPDGRRLSRVRILATAVDKFVSENGKFASLTLDDGTDTIRAKVFGGQSMIETIEKGRLIDVIGRIKQYQEEVYILPEAVIAQDDPNMEVLRRLELQEQERESARKRQLVLECKSQAADTTELLRILKERYGLETEEVEAYLQQEDAGKTATPKGEILKLIETLDAGEGCDYQELMQAAGIPEDALDAVMNDLLSEGSIFEPRPGKIKKL